MPSKYLPHAALALLVTPLVASAQTLSPDNVTQVDNIFAQWSKPDSPGCALGIYQDGKIVYKQGYGMANLNDDVPITPATVFHVASMSKQFTAASILLLAQQGKLSLDDDIHKYIPELPDFHEKITLRHLMHHTISVRMLSARTLARLTTAAPQEAGQRGSRLFPLTELDASRLILKITYIKLPQGESP